MECVANSEVTLLQIMKEDHNRLAMSAMSLEDTGSSTQVKHMPFLI